MVDADIHEKWEIFNESKVDENDGQMLEIYIWLTVDQVYLIKYPVIGYQNENSMIFIITNTRLSIKLAP